MINTIVFRQGFLEVSISYLPNTDRFAISVDKFKYGFFTLNQTNISEQKKLLFEAVNVRNEQRIINVLKYYFKRHCGAAGNWKLHTNFKQLKALRGEKAMVNTKNFIVVGEFNDNIYSKHCNQSQADDAAVHLTKTAPDKVFLVYELVTMHKAVLTTESIPVK